MTKDEALDLALEALQFALHVGFDESSESQIKKGDKAWQQHQQAITAIKQARALDKKAENARELGLDYEPVAWMYPDDYERMLTSETFCTVYSVEVGSATRGESSVALYTPSPAQPAPVQPSIKQGWDVDTLLDKPAAQRQWVGLTKTVVGNHLRRHALGDQPTFRQGFKEGVAFAELKLKEKNT
jgi:hypothetical protein